MHSNKITEMDTPRLLLSVDKFDRNTERMKTLLATKGVVSRPHLKTAKSVDVAQKVLSTASGPATVSTLKEAEVFAAAGITDLLYAVGIAPHKLPRVSKLIESGVNLCVLLDTQEQAEAVAEESRKIGIRVPAMIEIDCDGHRSGVKPDDIGLLEVIAEKLAPDAELRGVLSHAGLSYNSRDVATIEMWAERERSAASAAARALRTLGYEVPVVSVGSTPTALHSGDLKDITEVRTGVFMFFDLVQAGVGVCTQDDIAVSVLATVIGHQQDSHRIIVDAGWMALSRDRGTASQAVDQLYGVVCDVYGHRYDDLLVLDANQEHGLIGLRPGSAKTLPDLPIGTRVRILPNHACATAAQHEAYTLVKEGSLDALGAWPRFGGW